MRRTNNERTAKRNVSIDNQTAVKHGRTPGKTGHHCLGRTFRKNSPNSVCLRCLSGSGMTAGAAAPVHCPTKSKSGGNKLATLTALFGLRLA